MARSAGASGGNVVARTLRYRRPRKETSEISPLIKYLLFAFNVILWVRDWLFLFSLNLIFNYIFLARRVRCVWHWYLCMDWKRNFYTTLELVHWCFVRSGVFVHCRGRVCVCDWFLRLCWRLERKHNIAASCKYSKKKLFRLFFRLLNALLWF